MKYTNIKRPGCKVIPAPENSYFIRDKLTGKFVHMLAVQYVIWTDDVLLALEYPSKGIATRESARAETYPLSGKKMIRVKADIEVVKLTDELLTQEETK